MAVLVTDKALIDAEERDQVVEIFEELFSDFIVFMRLNKDGVQKLTKLAQSGNEKAEQILKYIQGFSDKENDQLRMEVLEKRREEFLKGSKHSKFFKTAWCDLDVKWEEPKIVNGCSVKFTLETMFHYQTAVRTAREIMEMYASTPLRKRFLQDILDVWLKEKGYKLKRYKDTEGHYYQEQIITYEDRKMAGPVPDNGRRSKDTVLQAKGVYEYEIVPL